MATYTHYKLPVLKSNDYISLKNYQLNQLVIVDNGTELKYYVVRDNTISYESVNDAINNEHLIPFGAENSKKNVMVFYNHTDNLSSKNRLFLRQVIFPKKDLVKVYINDELFEDWDFHGQVINPAGYVEHLEFPDGAPSGVVKIVYEEPLKYGGQYNLRLARKEGNSYVKARNALIPQTSYIDAFNGNGFLKSAIMNDSDLTSWDVTYQSFNSGDTYTIQKRFFNVVFAGGFELGKDFPDGIKLEVWGFDKNTNFNNSGNRGSVSQNRRGSYYPLYAFTKNEVLFDFIGATRQWGRTNQLRFRLRQEIDGKVYFSEFFKETLSIKHFPLFTTDATLSEKTYVGNYVSLRLV